MSVEVMDRMEEWAVTLSGKLEQLAAAHGDKAVDLALGAARVDALYSLTIGLALMIIAVVAGCTSNWFRKQAIEASETAPAHSDAPFGWGVGAVLIGMGAAVTGALALTKLANAWAWAGLFYPELWIAKKVLGF